MKIFKALTKEYVDLLGVGANQNDYVNQKIKTLKIREAQTLV